MSFIIMQPDDSAESSKAMGNLKPYQNNEFDTDIKGARVQPATAGCRLCTESESHHHSFIGQISADR